MKKIEKDELCGTKQPELILQKQAKKRGFLSFLSQFMQKIPFTFKRYNTNMPSSRMNQVQLLRLLASRLERLPVDSHWARRASGLRGNIIKLLEEADSGQEISSTRQKVLTEEAFVILKRAAQDIPDQEDLKR